MKTGHFTRPEAMQEATLRDSANTFRRNPRASQTGTWEQHRLRQLEHEIERRNRHRRGKGKA